MFDFLRVTGLFFVTAVAEIVGYYLLWRVDGVVPTRWDLVGGGICLVGMAIIALQPRAAS